MGSRKQSTYLFVTLLLSLVACKTEIEPTPLQTLSEHFPGPVSYYPRQAIEQSKTQRGFFQTLFSSNAQALENDCTVPTSGNQTILVLPVIIDEAQDPPADRDTPEKLSAFLFGTPNDGAVTLTTYYAQSSINTPLTLTGDVKPWKRITHSSSATNKTDGSEFTPKADPIVQATLAAFDEDIDYSLYDKNNDGCIDFVMIVHSGMDQAITRNPTDIWSHFEWYSADARHSFDDKILYGGSIISARSPIGIYAHEFAHNLGLPDLYSYGPPNKSMVGYWSLMDLGTWSGPPKHAGEKPTGIDAYGLTVLGWATEITTTFANTDPLQTSSPLLGSPSVVRIPLPSLNPNDANDPNHYLLVESRFNAAGRGVNNASAGIDAYLPSNGVLVWEIDEYGANYDGSPRPLVQLADAYPNEAVRGISPEALLADAPFIPPLSGRPGTRPAGEDQVGQSIYRARGITLNILSEINKSSHTISVIKNSHVQPELNIALVRITHDPHSLGESLSVRVEVTNVGGVAATDVQATMADVPSNPWSNTSPIIDGNDDIAPGDTKTFTWDMTTAAAGNVDLFASVTSKNAPDLTIRDRAYINGQISAFAIVDHIRMGEKAAEFTAQSWAFEHYNCTGNPYAEDCVTLGASNAFFAAPANDSSWTDLNPSTPNNPNTSGKALCYRGGGYNACRGEITQVWVRNFDGDDDNGNEILVAYRDILHDAWCIVHRNDQSSPCPSSVNPVGLSYLSMYRIGENGKLGASIWDFVPAKITSPQTIPDHYTQGDNLSFAYQVYACGGGLGISATVLDLPGRPNSILVTGLCGGAGVLFTGQNGTMNSILYPIERPYGRIDGSDKIRFSAHQTLAHGLLPNNTQSTQFQIIAVKPYNPDLNYTDQVTMFTLGTPEHTPSFTGNSLLKDVFTDAITSASLTLLNNQTSPLTEWWDSSSNSQSSWAYLSPKAFIADMDDTAGPEIVFADGNGFQTGRLLVFTWGENASHKEVFKVREKWGNNKSALLPHDFDDDGKLEIIVGDNKDNSLNVFKFVKGDETLPDRYESVFSDSFGGYTGTGYNPAIAVGDVDGDGTPNMVLGMGGHCSRPTVGDGVYVYGYGMVMKLPDLNGNGITDSSEDVEGMGVFAITTGDVDGDGSDEILLGTQSGDLIVLKHSTKASEKPVLQKVQQ